MATREIERSRWNEEFNRLSREHLGWVVNIEVIGEEIGAQVESRSLPFAGVSADIKDNENRIEISVGTNPESHTTHSIIDPARVYLKESDSGDDEVLEIETTEGIKTIVRFRASSQANAANLLPNQ